MYFVSIMFRNVQQVTLYDDTTTFRNVGQRTLQGAVKKQELKTPTFAASFIVPRRKNGRTWHVLWKN